MKLQLLFIFLLCVSFVNAEEIFIDTSKLSLAQINLSEAYCKNTKNKNKLCKSKSLSYIDFDDIDLPEYLTGLKKHLGPVLKNYEGENLKASTLSDIKDFDADILGSWSNDTTITLYAKTKNTYTLSSSSSGYTGGAHGYHAINFDNYDIGTQEKLMLKDLFLPDSNQTLHMIASKHYKVSHGLNVNQSLIDDGWFNNNFVLSDTFAITPNGILFYYNSYEIKPYAAGHTLFILPYSKLKNIINPEGVLNFALSPTATNVTSFYEKDQGQIDVMVEVNTNHTVTIRATMKNFIQFPKAWLSLSFPQFTSKKLIVAMESKGFKTMHTYSKGSKVYNNQLHKSIRSSYLLVEAEEDAWKDTAYSLSVTLSTPINMDELILDVRANLKSKTTSISIPNEYQGVTGQQGYTNYRIVVGL